MKKITCVSYHATGSSAIDDFFKEFDNCTSGPSDYEARLLQDPDGISDLEYNLVENPHRLNSGFALKRFRIFCQRNRRTYEGLYGKGWMNEVEKRLETEKKRSATIKSPDELESRLQLALEQVPTREKIKMPKWFAVVAALLCLSIVSYHYNAFAYYGNKLLGYEYRSPWKL